MKALVASVLLVLIVPARASTDTGHRFVELPLREGMAVVYLYREHKLFGMAAKPSIKVDGKEIGMLRNGTYLAMYVPAGTHKVDAKFGILYYPIKSCSTTIVVASGDSLFVRFIIDGQFTVITQNMVGSRWTTGFEVPEIAVSRGLIDSLKAGNSDVPEVPEVPTSAPPTPLPSAAPSEPVAPSLQPAPDAA